MHWRCVLDDVLCVEVTKHFFTEVACNLACGWVTSTKVLQPPTGGVQSPKLNSVQAPLVHVTCNYSVSRVCHAINNIRGNVCSMRPSGRTIRHSSLPSTVMVGTHLAHDLSLKRWGGTMHPNIAQGNTCEGPGNYRSAACREGASTPVGNCGRHAEFAVAGTGQSGLLWSTGKFVQYRQLLALCDAAFTTDSRRQTCVVDLE